MTSITLPRATVEQALEALEGSAGILQHEHVWPGAEKKSRFVITALRASLAQQTKPDLSRCPQCNGPADNGFDRSFPPIPYLCTKCMAEPVKPVAWVASKDGRLIYDYDFTHDAVLRVMGDFENDEQRVRYAKQIVDKLNAAPAQQAVAAAELLRQHGEIESMRAERLRSERRLLDVKAQRDALLEAGKRVKETRVFLGAVAQEMLDAAIAAVEGKKT